MGVSIPRERVCIAVIANATTRAQETAVRDLCIGIYNNHYAEWLVDGQPTGEFMLRATDNPVLLIETILCVPVDASQRMKDDAAQASAYVPNIRRLPLETAYDRAALEARLVAEAGEIGCRRILIADRTTVLPTVTAQMVPLFSVIEGAG